MYGAVFAFTIKVYEMKLCSASVDNASYPCIFIVYVPASAFTKLGYEIEHVELLEIENPVNAGVTVRFTAVTVSPSRSLNQSQEVTRSGYDPCSAEKT